MTKSPNVTHAGTMLNETAQFDETDDIDEELELLLLLETGSLVDKGANGGLAGSDVRILPDPPENALSLELTVMSSRALMWSNEQLW